MQWSDITFAPSTRTLRQFALLWLIFFGLLACVQGLVRDNPVSAAIFGALATAGGLVGLVKPPVIRPVYLGSVLLTFPIGWVVSKFLLACLFYCVFTPFSLVFRLLGRDILCRQRRPLATSYWSLKRASTNPQSYFRPF
jgi:hypothetical protein